MRPQSCKSKSLPQISKRSLHAMGMQAASSFLYFCIVILTCDSLAERSKAVAQGAIPKGRGFEPHSCHFLPSGPSKIRSHRPDSNLKAHIGKNKCTRRKTHRKDCYETIISLVIWGAYGHLADVISFVMRGLLIRLCIPGAARPHILHCPPPRLQNWPCFV